MTDTLTAPEQMADERKYQDDEVREIFDLAVGGGRIGPPATPDEGGLSLAELQAVGLEVGMKPERIAEAALAVDSKRGILPSRTYLGMPVSVGRVVELPGPVSDHEWQLLVAEFRDVFGARGRIASRGGVREWTNGNLHALVEPTATGHRLRLGTLKGDAMVLNRLGVAGLAAALILATAEIIATAAGFSVLTGDLLTLRGSVLPLILAGAGVGALLMNALRLPRWARAREGQMEYIAGRVGALVEAPLQPEKSES